MLQSLLTFMLFIMPFLVSQKKISRPGLHTGLWVSMFFWGRIHPLFSVLTFTVSLIYYICSVSQADTARNSAPASAVTRVSWISRPGSRPLICCLAIIIIFCAFGNACRDYGAALRLDLQIQNTAMQLGFAGSLAGPVLFGLCNDRTGPFTAFVILLFGGLGAVFFTALSTDAPYCFPFGSLLMQAVIGGVFTLTPQILLYFYGRPQLSIMLPFLLLFLSGLWGTAFYFYQGAEVPSQDHLLSMVFLLLTAAPLAVRAWRQRLAVL